MPIESAINIQRILIFEMLGVSITKNMNILNKFFLVGFMIVPCILFTNHPQSLSGWIN